jgi:hypothetical protein
MVQIVTKWLVAIFLFKLHEKQGFLPAQKNI